MAQFLKTFFASCLGILVGLLALFGIGSLILSGVASQANKPKPVKPNTVLHLKFDQPIPEHTNNVQSVPLEAAIKEEKILGLRDIANTLANAKEDDNVKGAFIEVDMLQGGFATSSKLREAIKDFKESGKFVVAHSKIYTQGAYYLASVADELYVNPMGIMDVRGFASQNVFYKNMLDRLGVDVQIFYAGKFKSATEPFRRTNMSEENKLQTRAYLNEFLDVYIADVADSRGLKRDRLRTVIDQYLADSPEDAVANQLADGVHYRTEVLEKIREKVGLEEKDELRLMNLQDYNKANPPSSNYREEDKIAVVYAEGSIVLGKGDMGVIGDKDYVKIIEDIARKDDIKAIVLRVNSPGGSALASENIWHSLSEAKANGKPIIVSMGDYAASGGYYIAAIADSIFAEANTITGSSSVFSLLPNVQQAANRQVGITFDSVKTGPFATGLTPLFSLTDAQAERLQQSTEETYQMFLKRVADGRDMPIDEVRKIAQGRVWSGRQGIDVGLVDKLGDLDAALAAAAKIADLKEYRVSEYPRIKDPLMRFLEELTGQEQAQSKTAQFVQKEFPQFYPFYEQIKHVQQASETPQARLQVHVPFK